MTNTTDFEVVIIGGSYAGLSAAMSLGRAMRKTLILDSGKPCNRQTPHSHNFITHDGATPDNIAFQARTQVLNYPSVTFLQEEAVEALREAGHFVIALRNGTRITTKKLLFTTGIIDIMPPIDGFSNCWGISVLHCPYCHGYEVRGVETGLLSNDDKTFDFVRLIRHWTDKLTLLTNGRPTLTEEQMQKIQSYNISIIEKEIQAFDHTEGMLKNVVFKDGTIKEFTAVYARLPFMQHSNLPAQLGCEITSQGYIQIDDFQKTSVAGVYAAGDNTSMFRAVSMAVAAGSKAGALMNKELVDETF